MTTDIKQLNTMTANRQLELICTAHHAAVRRYFKSSVGIFLKDKDISKFDSDDFPRIQTIFNYSDAFDVYDLNTTVSIKENHKYKFESFGPEEL